MIMFFLHTYLNCLIIVSSTPFHGHIYRSCSPDHTTKTPMSGGWSGPAFPKCLALVFGSFRPLRVHFPGPRERSSILNVDVLVTEGTPGRAIHYRNHTASIFLQPAALQQAAWKWNPVWLHARTKPSSPRSPRFTDSRRQKLREPKRLREGEGGKARPRAAFTGTRARTKRNNCHLGSGAPEPRQWPGNPDLVGGQANNVTSPGATRSRRSAQKSPARIVLNGCRVAWDHPTSTKSKAKPHHKFDIPTWPGGTPTNAFPDRSRPKIDPTVPSLPKPACSGVRSP